MNLHNILSWVLWHSNEHWGSMWNVRENVKEVFTSTFNQICQIWTYHQLAYSSSDFFEKSEFKTQFGCQLRCKYMLGTLIIIVTWVYFYFLLDIRYCTKGRFTLWTRMPFHGDVRVLIGCWTRPGITSVYTNERMIKWPWMSRSPKYIFQGIINVLTRSNMFCSERGKRGGLVGEGKGPW